MRFDVTAANRRVIEALTALSDGRHGTRGLLHYDGDPAGPPVTTVAGVFTGEPVPDLLSGPIWTGVGLELGQDHTEVAELDLYRGVLTTQIRAGAATIRSLAFVSIARPGVHGLEIRGPANVVEAGPALLEPRPQPTAAIVRSTGGAITVASDRAMIAAAAESSTEDVDGTRTMRRIVGIAAANGDGQDAVERRAKLLADRAGRDGFARLMAEHEAAWAKRWASAAIDLPARPELESALRFAQFHLLSTAPEEGEAAIGARGLTGSAYRGHVFWDTDVFVVPALAAMAPALAKTALRYRWQRLDAARQRARTQGLRGARFPWESAESGFEATPPAGLDLRGNLVPILTGQQEEHIVADVAWAVDSYTNWTGDEAFLREAGAEIMVATARYWHSRIERDPDGTAHIRGVIGPDEYHEHVDDSTFTNTMAAWNLRRSAVLGERDDLVSADERHAWLELADRLVDGYDRDRHLHEQHDGFFDLEPLTTRGLGEQPISADALLGRERIQRTQILKQADVLMLHHLIPRHLPGESLEADLDYYLPRTAHGSSLSPAITAAVLARAGRTGEALRWFEMAARFDLDDLSGTTAGGLHLATMGGLWQAFTMGFLGIRPTDDALEIQPKVPHRWATVRSRFRYRDATVQVDASADALAVASSDEIAITLDDETHRCRFLSATRSDGGWRRT